MSDLVKRANIADLVAAFEHAAATVRRCFGELVEEESRLNSIVAMGDDRHRIRLNYSRYGRTVDYHKPDDVIREMTRDCWYTLVERLELRRMMSASRWTQLELRIDRHEMPDITLDNVASFAHEHLVSLPDMLTEAVHEVFEWLRPHNDRYKRNSQLEVPSKLILESIVRIGGRRYEATSYAKQRLTALENVFNALDGKGQIAKQYQSDLQMAIEASTDGKGETALFRFSVHKNGNMHLEFRRKDLLARFNQIAGGARLRPGKAA